MTDAHGAKLSISRVLIADDRMRTRRALAAVLAVLPWIQVVGEAADGQEAVTEVDRLQPNVVIMDILMPRLDGIRATAQIKAGCPGIRVVVHSLYLDWSVEAIAAGAEVFVPKGAPIQDLVEALVATSDRP